MNDRAIATEAEDYGPPRVLLLGTVQIEGAVDALVEPTRRTRLTELAAILATNPGCDHTTIDACYYPGERVTDNGRNTQISKLRRWLGRNPLGEDYLPRYHAAGHYHLHDEVTSDWDQWLALLPAGPIPASTDALEQALSLVRGRPFDGVRARRYGWAETLKQQMITAIVDAAYELARRRLMEGDWRAAETATVLGLSIEPGMERLWRMRILAAHASGNTAAVQEAVDRLMVITDDLGSDLEPATDELLTQLAERSKISRRPRPSAGGSRAQLLDPDPRRAGSTDGVTHD